MKKLIPFVLSFVFMLCLLGCSAESASIGIIGGADGPTAIFVTSNTNWLLVSVSLVVIVAAVLLVLAVYRNKKKKNIEGITPEGIDVRGKVANIYLSKSDFQAITSQSCDTSKLVVDLGDKLILCEHGEYEDLGHIRCKEIKELDRAEFSVCADIGDAEFTFDKMIFHDNGLLDAIRYNSAEVGLYIFASEHNAILTLSRCDLFDEDPELFEEEAELKYKYND